MAKTAYRVRNWTDYNKSLIQRGSLTFWFSQEVIQDWQVRTQEPGAHGNQKYTNLLITAALTLRQLFRLPLRATEGLMRSIAQLMRIDVVTPHYSTLCRRSKTLRIALKAKPVDRSRHVLVDSTGIKILGESEWKAFRYGVTNCKYSLWRKLHIAIDADNQDILAATMTESARLDGNYLPGLIDQIEESIHQITGDGAYDKKCCYQTAYQRQAKPVFPPQHNAAVQRRQRQKDPALLPRDHAISIIGRGEQRAMQLKIWKGNNSYHKRSLIETMMFRMKSIFGDEIKSRSIENQRTDLFIRCYAINKINQLGLPVSQTA